MNGILFSLLSALLGFVVVCFTIPPLIRVVNAKKLYEPVDKRRSHNSPIIPTIGGVAIFFGFMVATFLASNGFDLNNVKYLFPASIIMLFVGLKDDLVTLSARKKLIIQFLVAVMLVTMGQHIRLASLYGILGIWQLDYFSGALISVIAIVAFINAYNFIDGIDGLATGVGIIISTTFGVCFILMKKFDLSIISFALAGSLIAFFRYNVFGKKYKLFMGDTGSLIVGTILPVLALKFVEFAPSSGLPIISESALAFCVGLMVVPIIDFLRIFIVRIWNRKSPFQPDNNHLHHKVLSIFKIHFTSTLIICAGNILFIVLTLLLIDFKMNINYIIAILLFAGFLASYISFNIRKFLMTFLLNRKGSTSPD